MDSGRLDWLPTRPDWKVALRSASEQGTLDWNGVIAFSRFNLDFTMTLMLDRAARKLIGSQAPQGLTTRPVRLAMLASATVDHLLPGIRVAGLRRGIWIETYAPDFGQYLQALADPSSALRAFEPTAILIALDGRHLVGGLDAAATRGDADAFIDQTVQRCMSTWALASRTFDCRVIHQAPLPVFHWVVGHNEHRLPGSKVAALEAVTNRLRHAADSHGVDMLSIDRLAGEQGLNAWHDPSFWHKAKHEVSAVAAPMYGDHVGRLLAAQQGRSAKCLVLDLDNTLWGGIVGDDGVEGIVLGQGNGTGEAFIGLQQYVQDLSRRGVILAVCSKNDEVNALLPFEYHPDMILKRADIACFIANWNDKAGNIRRIAAELNIGVDSLVFLDDNPFERNIVRAELPEVSVPEVPDDPAMFVERLVAGGYFEASAITAEDLARSSQYQANAERKLVLAAATDLDGYLAQLDMELAWQPFDGVGLKRIAQLINKTNQFNLTTRRYNEEEVRSLIADPGFVTLQIRLSDRFGDNGMIGVVIGRIVGSDLSIDTWLMSCRVLGRKVEQATLNVLAREAGRRGMARLVGEYRPSDKNSMVAGHYRALGFSEHDPAHDLWSLDVNDFAFVDVPMKIVQLGETANA